MTNSKTAEAVTKPEYFRLPKPGTVDPHFGCSRSFWNGLILPTKQNGGKPPVRSIAVKKPDALRGIRMINFESARRFFEKVAQEADQKKDNRVEAA